MKYSKEAKPERAGGGGAGARAVPVALMLLLLCGFSFYLGGIYSTGRTFTFSSTTTSIIPIVSTTKPEGSAIALAIARNGNGDDEVEFSECPADYQDYTPCTDPKRWRRYGNYRLSFMERHCPPPPERAVCLVPPPRGYKPPIRWPKSKDQCWYRNVPYDWINSQKSNQHWLRKDGDRFTFPGGGTMFPNGVGAYVDLMADLIDHRRRAIVVQVGQRVREALDRPHPGRPVEPLAAALAAHVQHLPEAAPLDALVDQVHVPAGGAEPVELDDVPVADVRQGPHFVLEALLADAPARVPCFRHVELFHGERVAARYFGVVHAPKAALADAVGLVEVLRRRQDLAEGELHVLAPYGRLQIRRAAAARRCLFRVFVGSPLLADEYESHYSDEE